MGVSSSHPVKTYASEDKGSISTEFQPRFGKPTSPPKGGWFQTETECRTSASLPSSALAASIQQQSEGMAWHAILLKQKQYHTVKLKNKLLETVRKSSPTHICLLNLLLFLFDLLLFFDVLFDIFFDLLKSIGEELRHGVSYSYSGRVSNLPRSKYQRLEVEKKESGKIKKRPKQCIS